MTGYGRGGGGREEVRKGGGGREEGRRLNEGLGEEVGGGEQGERKEGVETIMEQRRGGLEENRGGEGRRGRGASEG
jgi:hypothetical protein